MTAGAGCGVVFTPAVSYENLEKYAELPASPSDAKHRPSAAQVATSCWPIKLVRGAGYWLSGHGEALLGDVSDDNICAVRCLGDAHVDVSVMARANRRTEWGRHRTAGFDRYLDVPSRAYSRLLKLMGDVVARSEIDLVGRLSVECSVRNDGVVLLDVEAHEVVEVFGAIRFDGADTSCF